MKIFKNVLDILKIKWLKIKKKYKELQYDYNNH